MNIKELDDDEQYNILQILIEKFGTNCQRVNGVSFLMKDGTVDNYDTQDYNYFEFLERDEEFYEVKMTYDYKIPKKDVEKYKFYHFSFQSHDFQNN